MKPTRVSVIIPCYNRATVVAETISCVLRQTLPPDEIIAVDDGSTDNTVEVLESFGSRLRILRQENAGPGAARNAGLAVATGEYVWFMDSDDLASLNKLEIQVHALEQSGADIAIAPWIKCRLDANRAYPEAHVLQQRGLPSNPARALVSNWSVVLQTALFRRSLLNKVGGFNPGAEFVVVEDQLLFLKCLLAGARLVHTSECLVIYRTDAVNKLTDAGLASEKRLVNWANYLLEARRSFAEAGQDPCSWFSFRLRLWCAWRELIEYNTQSANKAAALVAAALVEPSTHSLYGLAKRGFELLGGFRQRAFGDRSPLALRAGPLRSGQVSLLSNLGYSVML